MIYIPTLTSTIDRVKTNEYDNILYSPNKKKHNLIVGKNITIWDNHTFYWHTRYNKSDRHEKAREHYKWLIQFILDNYREGITLITPDVEWLKYRQEIEKEWLEKCYNYPQLYVPNTWQEDISKLNIVGYALRKNTPKEIIHKKWNHCLGHIRDIDCELLTYDSIIKRDQDGTITKEYRKNIT